MTSRLVASSGCQVLPTRWVPTYGPLVQHVTMSDKSLLVGDEVVSLLLEYAALIAKTQGGDTVRLRAYGADGVEVDASFLLNSGTVLMAETSTSTLPEPDNSTAEQYLREQLDNYSFTGFVGFEPESEPKPG